MEETVIKFTRGIPPLESFPTTKLVECAREVLEKDSATVLQYGKSGGFLPLRKWISDGYHISPERVIIGQGSLQLVDILSRIIITPGDIVYTEDPTYDRTATVLRRAGANIIGFPLSQSGPDIDEVETRLFNGERPKLFYTIPDFQNPTGMVIPFESRKRLLSLAEKYNFWIIEDSPYRLLRYFGKEIPTLFEMNPDRVIQMSSFSKLISPGLRVGYAILPDDLAPGVMKFAEDTYINASYFNQAIIMEFIRKGWLASNLIELKKLYTPRLEAILKSLDSEMKSFGTWQKPEGGFFIGFTTNFPLETESLLKKAQENGLELTDGRGFFVSSYGNRFIRLPFCALTPDEIILGIQRLAKILKFLKP